MTQFILTKESPEIIRFFRNISTLSKMLDDQEKNLRPVLNGERYITDSELAEKLKLTRRTLADYRMNGRLPYYKVGGKLLYKEKDILVLLEKTGWKHLIIGNTRFQVSRHKHKKVMETIKREGFMAFFLITEPADYKFFILESYIGQHFYFLHVKVAFCF